MKIFRKFCKIFVFTEFVSVNEYRKDKWKLRLKCLRPHLKEWRMHTWHKSDICGIHHFEFVHPYQNVNTRLSTFCWRPKVSKHLLTAFLWLKIFFTILEMWGQILRPFLSVLKRKLSPLEWHFYFWTVRVLWRQMEMPISCKKRWAICFKHYLTKILSQN